MKYLFLDELRILASSFQTGVLEPLTDEAVAVHLDAALAWIERAHAACGGKGISKGYHLLRRRWAPAYPETTGYTIPTLMNLASLAGYGHCRRVALELAEYLLGARTKEGGVAHWQRTTTAPVVFDTGQVMFGWLAAFEATGEARFLEAAARAGQWLASVQDASGCWRTFQHLGTVKVIDARVAWAMLRLAAHTNERRVREAAERHIGWVMTRQDASGWFDDCAFRVGDDPLTHTLAYTAEGLIECGVLLGAEGPIAAGRRAAQGALNKQRGDGTLAGTFGPGWKETSRWSCLTGNCQWAAIWLRLRALGGDDVWQEAAARAIAGVARTQALRTDVDGARGGIAGSRPIVGAYERLGFPNWAAKFFIDALLAWRVSRGIMPRAQFVG